MTRMVHCPECGTVVSEASLVSRIVPVATPEPVVHPALNGSVPTSGRKRAPNVVKGPARPTLAVLAACRKAVQEGETSGATATRVIAETGLTGDRASAILARLVGESRLTKSGERRASRYAPSKV